MSGVKPAECPWCHTAVKDLRAPCPHCGKLASDLRTTDPPEASAHAVAAAAVTGYEMPDIPDLVIPTAPKPSVKPATKAVPPPAAASSESATAFDDDLGMGADLQIDLSEAQAPKPGIARPPTPGVGFNPFDDDISAGPSLELDTTGGSLPPRASSPGPTSASSLPPVPPPPVSHRSLQPPMSAPPAPEAPKPAVDAYEARVLADYGPKPEAFWHAPMYAYRVVTRRSALQRDLASKRSESDRAQKRVEDALVALGERGRANARPGIPALDRVKQAEDLLRNRDGALAGAMDAHKGTLGEIDGRLGAAEIELGRAREDQARAETTRDAADEDWKRADAKVKRLEIEIRNGANKSGERDALLAESAQKNGKRTETEQKLAEARRVTAVAQAKVDAIGNERAAAEARFSRQSGTRNAGVDDAQGHLRGALVELGRALLADPSAAELAHARSEIERLEQQAQKGATDVALHESAVRAYDAPQVFLGMVLVAIALLLVLVLILFPFIYRAVAT
jgi:hypothetical protein